MQYTIQERVFIVRTYWITGSVTQCQREYRKRFGERQSPARNTILNLAKKLETTGSLVDVHTGGRPAMSEETVRDVQDRLQHSPLKSLRRLSQETSYSYSTCQRAAKKGKLEPYRVTAVQELKPQDLQKQQLKQQRDKLRQYQKKITLQLEKERQLAKQLLKDGKKEKALLLLKKKRFQEQLLDKTENQISNLERMVQDIEFAQIEMKVIEGLKVGNDCLKKMHEVLSIEEVERIMDETHDAVEYQKQIDDILSGSLTQEDEDAVLAELEAITQEEVELPEVPDEPLPMVPDQEQESEPEKVKKPERELLAV